MASELRVDTLKDSSGNNSVGMSYVAEGSSKAWSNLNGQGTIASRDSLNIASYTDNGTGDYTHTFSNAMANVNYCWLLTADYSDTDARNVNLGVDSSSQTTGAIRIHSYGLSSVRQMILIQLICLFQETSHNGWKDCSRYAGTQHRRVG